jgi:hypothetical protein
VTIGSAFNCSVDFFFGNATKFFKGDVAMVRSPVGKVNDVGDVPSVPTSYGTHPSIVVERHGAISWVLRPEHRSHGLQVQNWIRLEGIYLFTRFLTHLR